MKIREYKVKSLKGALFFCPSCHRQMDLPFKGAENIKVESALNIACGNCKHGKIKVTIIKEVVQ